MHFTAQCQLQTLLSFPFGTFAWLFDSTVPHGCKLLLLGPAVAPVAVQPPELAKRCGLVFQFPERYFLGGTLQEVQAAFCSILMLCLRQPVFSIFAVFDKQHKAFRRQFGSLQHA